MVNFDLKISLHRLMTHIEKSFSENHRKRMKFYFLRSISESRPEGPAGALRSVICQERARIKLPYRSKFNFSST